MGNTVTNQGMTIATKGSTHDAVFTKDDMCINENTKLPEGYQNAVLSTKLDANKSEDTFIEDKNIALMSTEWGGTSRKEHTGKLGGVDSKTYLAEAQGTDGSPNLIIESEKTMRTGDPTTQNHGNTTGQVQANEAHITSESTEELRKKQCQIAEFDGVCEGRHLGWPSKNKTGDAYYLEILDTDSVEFTTLRKDVTRTPHEENPPCPDNGKHTEWQARTIEWPLPIDPGPYPGHGEQFTAHGHWACNEFILSMFGYNYGSPEGAQDYGWEWGGENMGADRRSPDGNRMDYAKQLAENRRKAGPHGAGPMGMQLAPAEFGSPLNSGAENRAIADQATREQYKEHKEQQASREWSKPDSMKDNLKSALKTELKEIMMFWAWKAFPPTIDVEATSCGGSRKAQLKVFPHKKFKFELDISAKSKLAAHGTRRPGEKIPGQRKLEDKLADNKQDQRAARGQKQKANKYLNKAREPNQKGKDKRNRAQAQKAQATKALAKYEKAERQLEMMIATLKGLQRVLDTGEKIAKYGGEKLTVKFLKQFGLEWVIQYAHCTEEKKGWIFGYYTPAHCGREWEITVKAEPWLGCGAELRISLINFIVPAGGQAIGKLLRRFRLVHADIVFRVNAGIVGTITFKKDVYDYPVGEVKITFRIDLFLSMSLAIGAGGVDALELRASFPFSGSVNFYLGTKAGEMIQMNFEASLKPSFQVIFFPDSWWEMRPAFGRFAPRAFVLSKDTERVTLFAGPG